LPALAYGLEPVDFDPVAFERERTAERLVRNKE
jgi:hypothetical protein